MTRLVRWSPWPLLLFFLAVMVGYLLGLYLLFNYFLPDAELKPQQPAAPCWERVVALQHGKQRAVFTVTHNCVKPVTQRTTWL